MSASGSQDPRLSREGFRGNPLAAALDAARPSAGAGMMSTQHFGGVALSARRQSRGRISGSVPYILGSTVHGSDTAGPGGTDGPWGGSGDLSGLGDGSTPFTDTWHRDRMPLTPDDEPTDCVDIDDGWRYHELSPTEGLWVFTDDSATPRGYYAKRYQSFKRTRRYDRHGLLSVTAESYGPIFTDATFMAT